MTEEQNLSIKSIQDVQNDNSPQIIAKELDYHARMGQPLPAGVVIAKESMIIEALKTVQDPELMLDVYSLGLIYKIDITPRGDVTIEMTLTSPMCPIAGEMPGMVALAVSKVDGVGVVNVFLVWDPPWTLDMLDDDLKMALGFDVPQPE